MPLSALKTKRSQRECCDLLKNLIIAVIFSAGAILLGQVGLMTLVAKGFTFLGYVSIPMIFIPTVFFTWKRAKMKDAGRVAGPDSV